MSQRVVITGIGVVAANGLGCEAFVSALHQGRSGIHRITEFDTSMLQTKSAGTVQGFEPGGYMANPDVRRTPRTVHLAAAAAQEAMGQAGLRIDPADVEAGRQIGVMLGSGGGGLAFVEGQYRHYFRGERGYTPFAITSGTHGNLSSELSIQLGLRGPSHVISTGCTSSTDALGYAAMHIRSGTCPMMLAGGADAPIAEGILKGFEMMRILASEKEDPAAMSRPFSLDRDGFVLGEGSWMFLLEDFDHAAARQAPVLAEILGYGSTCDAFHRVQPAPDATESARAVEVALRQAGIAAGELGYVNLHGTSTEMNDRLETLAMHKALGASAPGIPMSSTKSMIGHPQGACGAAGLAATILSVRAGFLHSTINLRQRDPACDLDYIAEGAREIAGGGRGEVVALCNCIAFGSKNSALVVRVPRG